MSKPKINTGIKALDDVGNMTVDAAAAVGTGGLSLINSSVGKDIEAGIQGAATNLERNIANLSAGAAMATKGDFSSLDRTLIDASLIMTGGGFINPDETGTVTGRNTAVEDLTAKAVKDAQDAAAADEATRIETNMADIRSVISGQVSARTRAPGRNMTLIGGQQASNTLLSLVGA